MGRASAPVQRAQPPTPLKSTPWPSSLSALGCKSRPVKGRARPPGKAQKETGNGLQQGNSQGGLDPGAESAQVGQSEGKEGDRRTRAGRQRQVLPLPPSERASPRSMQSLVQEPAGTNRRPQEPVTWLTWHLLRSVQRLEQDSVPGSKPCLLALYPTKPGGGGTGWAEAPGSPGKEKSGGRGCPGDPVTLRHKDTGSPHLGPCRARLAR